MDYVVKDQFGNELQRFDNEEEAEEYASTREHIHPGLRFEVEQDDETTDDNDTSMSNSYQFISTEEEQDEETTTAFDTVGSMWNLGDHSTASSDERSALSQSIEDTMAALDDDIDGDMKAVLEDASDLVEDTRINKFECPVEICGLGHSHPDHKHDIRESFDVLGSFTDQMDFCPYCHCGVNELSMLMAFYPYISETVFADHDRFEGVSEVAPDILDSMYRHYVQKNVTVNRAAAIVATELGLNESEAVPLGVRGDVEEFFERRSSIEEAANAAPIAQETRNAIEENREELEEVTSQ
jgi:hypothetical protein